MTTTSPYDHTAPRAHDAHPVHGASLAHSAPVLAAPMTPAPLRTAGSHLGPGEDFPEDLTGLGMAELQVLHSRITRQLDHDWLTDPDGPHCCTMDRRQELLAELDARDTA
ncbi:hypothetical protein ACT4S2_09270 [Kocuria turfanensis]|uniref:hypothetical protein n=1 Tax=Kocuria turfanensis TaxID=388357 RepID=UPI004034FE70